MIFSDFPEALDTLDLRNVFVNLKCVSKDPIHVALAIEKASGEKCTRLSSMVRRCLLKFRVASPDPSIFYVKGGARLVCPTLQTCMQTMTQRMATRRHSAIMSERYEQQPYATGRGFLMDVAALCKVFPESLKNRLKDGSVLSSLAHATRPEGLEYLMNFARFVQRYPQETVPYGTTRNEAFHRQLKSFFRNIMHQSARNARIVCDIAC